MASKPVVALLNRSTCVADAAVAALLPALQKQVSGDLVAAWGSGADADLIFVEDKGVKLDPMWQPIVIGDVTDQVTALGYHELTATGQPMGKVFARTDLDYGEVWQRTVSHELLELLVDPACISVRSVTYRGRPVMTAVEVADAVESDAAGYEIDGQPVSGFVFPAFFDTVTEHPAGTRFDQTGKISAPMTIAPGGYLSILDPSAGTGWTMVFGQHVPLHKRLAPRGSRRERRELRDNHRRPWQRSVAP